MRRLLVPMFAALGLLAGSHTLDAHHSFSAEYDANRPITFTGSVTKVEWMNPHVYVYVQVIDTAKGSRSKTTIFAVENASPNVLRRVRWGKDSVRVGDQITVYGYRAKNGSDTVNAVTLKLPDGSTLFAGSSYDGERPAPRK